MNKTFENKIKCLVIIIILLILDQLSKYYIFINYEKIINKDLLIFTFEYVTNNGAAFNILSGNRIFLSGISIISSIILYYFIFIKDTKIINRYGLSFIFAGSLGNGIDRIFVGNVIDFIKIKFINFPIFNIADVAINIGALILIIGYLKFKN